MLKNRDIIITGLQSWHINIGSNCKNIAIELAKNNRVLYVNRSFDRLATFSKNKILNKLKQEKRDKSTDLLLKQVSANLWVFQPETILESISRLPFNGLFDYFNKKNNERFALEIHKAIEHLKFSDFIHFCDSDMFRSLHLKELLKPKTFVYYSRDNLQAVKYWQVQGQRIEPIIMKSSDIVLTNSIYLEKLALAHNPKSYFVGQGCNVSAFQPKESHEIPNDVKDIKGPLIGYVGVLKSLRLDLSVLEYIALNKPEWSIVLIGPEDKDFQNSKLHQLSNIHFLGSKAEYELPEYINALDVTINPQILNEVTRGNYPRKIDEYLAMGKPVVATKTDAMVYFDEHVHLAESPSDWINAIEKALKTISPMENKIRRDFANQHTWEHNVAEIGNQIIKFENNTKQQNNHPNDSSLQNIQPSQLLKL
nr:glycosyltransferase [uncultured Carboxylicivirga sp.]